MTCTSKPRYEDFRPRTIWSLSNAFASAFKELDPTRNSWYCQAGTVSVGSHSRSSTWGGVELGLPLPFDLLCGSASCKPINSKNRTLRFDAPHISPTFKTAVGPSKSPTAPQAGIGLPDTRLAVDLLPFASCIFLGFSGRIPTYGDLGTHFTAFSL